MMIIEDVVSGCGKDVVVVGDDIVMKTQGKKL